MNVHFVPAFLSLWGYGFRVSPRGGSPFDCVRKRFIGFYRFKRFKVGGAAHKNQKRRGVLIALRAVVRGA